MENLNTYNFFGNYHRHIFYRMHHNETYSIAYIITNLWRNYLIRISTLNVYITVVGFKELKYYGLEGYAKSICTKLTIYYNQIILKDIFKFHLKLCS